MSLTLFNALKAYSGLDAETERTLRDLHPRIRHEIPAIVADFYARILEHEGTRRVLEGPEQVVRLKASLERWLTEVFLRPRDEAYYAGRARIGLIHVRVGLSQVYVVGAMSHIRRRLMGAVVKATGREPELLLHRLEAVGKALDIDLAIIAGSYHEAEMYRDFVELSPDMVLEIDGTGRITSINRTGVKLLGYPREEIVERSLLDFVPPAESREATEPLHRLFESGGQTRFEVRLLAHDGTSVDVEVLANAVHHPLTGSVVRARAYVRDVRERRHAEAALRRERDSAQRYLDIAGSIICVIDSEGTFTLMNRKGCEVLGYSEAEILGQRIELVVPARHRAELRSTFQRLVNGELQSAGAYEGPVLTKDGRERVIEWQNTLLRDDAGNVVGALSSGIDVTDRKRMQQTIVERESLTRLGEMAAVVAHEVKNPIAGIHGALQVIQGHLPAASSDRKVIQEILERLDALNSSVDDLLLFARPRLPRRVPIPILALLQNTAALLMQDASLAGLEVAISGPEVVVPGDAELLKPVFLNLLLNAAQAMNRSGKVSVTVQDSRKECRVDIADAGPGIPEELRAKVFEPFFSTKHRGTGLGLPIARRIVEAHGGEIAIHCPPGAGTVVTVRLPIREGDALARG